MVFNFGSNVGRKTTNSDARGSISNQPADAQRLVAVFMVQAFGEAPIPLHTVGSEPRESGIK